MSVTRTVEASRRSSLRRQMSHELNVNIHAKRGLAPGVSTAARRFFTYSLAVVAESKQLYAPCIRVTMNIPSLKFVSTTILESSDNVRCQRAEAGVARHHSRSFVPTPGLHSSAVHSRLLLRATMCPRTRCS